MARTRTSLFCARCKRVLADIAGQARDDGYEYHEEQVDQLFGKVPLPFLEGYLYALCLLVGLYDRIQDETDLQQFINIAAITDRKLKGDMEWTGFKKSLLDGTVIFLQGEGSILRYRLFDLLYHYFKRIDQLSLLCRGSVARSRHYDEIDDICRAVSKAAEKV